MIPSWGREGTNLTEKIEKHDGKQVSFVATS